VLSIVTLNFAGFALSKFRTNRNCRVSMWVSGITADEPAIEAVVQFPVPPALIGPWVTPAWTTGRKHVHVHGQWL